MGRGRDPPPAYEANMSIERIADAALKRPVETEHLKSPRTAKEPEPQDKNDQKKGPEEVEAIASEVQIFLKRLNTELRFEVNSESREVIVKIVDPESDEVIRQIPSEELLAIRERMEDLVGVLYKART